MTAKPCLVCGTPTLSSHCDEHRPRDTRTNRQHVAWRNDTRWKQLSKRLRRASPFCERCGAVEMLSVDHIIPVSECPELTYATENCRILCKPCNGQRGNKYTDTEAHTVLTRLQDSYRRRPTKTGHERLNAALRTRGDTPNGTPNRPVGKAQSALHMTTIFNKDSAATGSR